MFSTNYEIIFALIIVVGLIKIVIDSFQNIVKGRYSLDYIAFVTMVLSLALGQYLAGAIIALMFIGGEALESFASHRAYRALKKLSDTIPKKCVVEHNGGFVDTPIQQVSAKQIILIKRSEIVPLDGIIVSPAKGLFNLANLTGEVGAVMMKKGTFIKSGSINVGETLRLQVVGDFSTSAYQKIVGLVEDAKLHPANTVKLSERANFYFTLVTLIIAGLAYAITGDLVRLLAVLVIATPCPLIIAAPAAFVSGMSRVARSGIILRRPAALEGINNASVIFFDKTGTLTLGEPVLSSTDISDEILGIAAGLEIHSLHPLARTIVNEARRRKIRFAIAQDVQEELGKGISGTIRGERYLFSGVSLMKNGVEIARFRFDDVLKDGATRLLSRLKAQGIRTAIITGDKKQNAEKIFKNTNIDIHASQTPAGKFRLIEAAKKNGDTVVMIGDGLNDAPALAKADVGIVFSGTENGATIDAADVAILGSGLEKVDELFSVSRHTMRVAKQSIYGGIGFSIIGMTFAAFGYISPVHGALLQEGIDIVVILNALRALTKY